MTKEIKFRLTRNWIISIYHFYDNWLIKDRFSNIQMNLFGFGWENFSRKKILNGSNKYNIYLCILGINFTFMKYKKRRRCLCSVRVN